MRLLFIGFGFYPRFNGGAALIQWEMLKSSVKLGFEPVIFQAGGYDVWKAMRLKRRVTKEGFELIALMNSPNRPGVRNPTSQVFDHRIVTLSRQVLESVRPDLVHIHELTFHCAAIIDLCNHLGIPTVKTAHNYWDVCPQRDLLYNGETICRDYQNGLQCVECRQAWPQSPWLTGAHDLLYDTPFYALGRQMWRAVRPTRSKFLASRVARSTNDAPVIAPARLKEAAQEYANRRQEFVRNLNTTRAVHVYSRRSGEILQQYGVKPEKILYFPVTTEAIDMISPRDLHTGHLPVVFGYRGGLAPHKGVHLLIEAFKRLDQSKARLAIYGSGQSQYLARLIRLSEGANISFYGEYKPNELSAINAAIDVGIIPSIWEELFGLVGVEYIQCRVPVVASDLGGTREYVVNGENGFLFKANDVDSLSETLQRFVEQPGLIRTMQSTMRRWISVEDMTRNLAQLYIPMASR